MNLLIPDRVPFFLLTLASVSPGFRNGPLSRSAIKLLLFREGLDGNLLSGTCMGPRLRSLPLQNSELEICGRYISGVLGPAAPDQVRSPRRASHTSRNPPDRSVLLAETCVNISLS